jgi:hypothetical protein
VPCHFAAIEALGGQVRLKPPTLHQAYREWSFCELSGDAYACRTRTDDADVRFDGASVLKLSRVYQHVIRRRHKGTRPVPFSMPVAFWMKRPIGASGTFSGLREPIVVGNALPR